MTTNQIREPGKFGKRTEPHTILISRNGRTRKFTINPFVFSAFSALLIMFMVGYFVSTAYLVFRDDLIGASYARNARMQHEYEDRIAALRTKLDRITSRQLLDQQAIENRVAELMERQNQIGSRSKSMNSLVTKARKKGLGTSLSNIPIPSEKPSKDDRASLDNTTTGSIDINGPVETTLAFIGGFSLRGAVGSGKKLAIQPAPGKQKQTIIASINPNSPELNTEFTKGLFGSVANAIGDIDASQRVEIDNLRIAAARRADKIAKVLTSLGHRVEESSTDNIGGPFIPLDHSVDFKVHLQALESALFKLENVSKKAKSLPVSEPLPGAKITSQYGSRSDPFTKKWAMHSGMDFRAARGTPIRASGGGIIVKAGRNGGYGKIVEIKHRNGYTSRYAHLSRIKVKVGQRVKLGQTVGLVGSTGRSTGPHLHYEIRSSGKTIDPAKFIKAGKRLKGHI